MGFLKSGRTHMQDAVPMRLGQEFAAYAVAVQRCQQQIEEQSNYLRELGLGGSAVGTGINTHPDYRAESSCKPRENLETEINTRRGYALRDAVKPGDVCSERVHYGTLRSK
jgi:aspartate ammonia-lyase